MGLATHYHTDWVAPNWSGSLDKIAAVRTHLFFRWKEGWGRPIAFVSRPSETEPLIAKMSGLSSVHAGGGTDGSTVLASSEDGTTGGRPNSFALAHEQDLPAIRALPALRGASVVLVHPEGDSFVLWFDPATKPGSYSRP